MALSLGVKLYGSVFLDDTRFVLTKMNDDGTFRLSGMNKDFHIERNNPCEVYPNVEVLAGDSHVDDSVRVVIKAPDDIVILRGKIYWTQKENTEVEL